jgi:hypothetical protein
MPQIGNNRVVETTTEARAAVTGQNVRYVLVFALLGAIGLFAIVALYMLARAADWRAILNVVFSIGYRNGLANPC